MGNKKSVNLEMLVTFYDQHPGIGGATVPLPGQVKKVIDELNGKTMTLAEGLKKIKAAGIGTVEVVEDYNYIMLTLGEWPPKKSPCHSWSLIKYNPKQKEIIKPPKKGRKT